MQGSYYSNQCIPEYEVFLILLLLTAIFLKFSNVIFLPNLSISLDEDSIFTWMLRLNSVLKCKPLLISEKLFLTFSLIFPSNSNHFHFPGHADQIHSWISVIPPQTVLWLFSKEQAKVGLWLLFYLLSFMDLCHLLAEI